MTDILGLERKQEMLDNESYMLIRQKSEELEQLMKSIEREAQELETVKYENLQGQARVTALEAELANETIEKESLASNISQISMQLNKLQEICDFLQADNLRKTESLNQCKEELENSLEQMYTEQANLTDAQKQLTLFTDRNRLYAEKNSLIERELEEKEKDIVALAQRCRSLVKDNERVSKKAYESKNEIEGLLAACKLGGCELLQAHNDIERRIKEKSEAIALLERCCEQNLDLRNIKLSAKERARKSLLALCRACEFIQILREKSKSGNIDQEIDKQEVERKLDRLTALDFASIAESAEKRGSYKKELFSASGVAKSRASALIAHPKYKASEAVLNAREEAEELKALRRKAEQIAEEERDSNSQRNSIQSRNNMLAKQNEELESEVELRGVQIDGFEKEVADLTEEITEKNSRLTELESNVSQVKNVLERELREQTNRAQIASAKVSVLTETLDEREHRILALERDFERVQARVRVKETELEGARRIVGSIHNESHNLESAIESKRERLKDLEKQIEQW